MDSCNFCYFECCDVCYVSLMLVPTLCSLILTASWGYPFLAESYLYHLTRLDHRHNFSYHFYDIYLGLRASSASTAVDMQSIAARVLGSSFLPQFGAVTVVGAGLALHRAIPLSFIWFLQTFTFVTFNRVCTSQVGSSQTRLSLD